MQVYVNKLICELIKFSRLVVSCAADRKKIKLEHNNTHANFFEKSEPKYLTFQPLPNNVYATINFPDIYTRSLFAKTGISVNVTQFRKITSRHTMTRRPLPNSLAQCRTIDSRSDVKTESQN